MLVAAPGRPARRRGGVTIVESAFVLMFFLMFLFGIFEYGRYLMVLHVASNAARDGARYAAVNTDKPSNFDTTATSVTVTTSSGTQTVNYVSVQQYVLNKMAGCDRNISGFTITVFPVDTTQLYNDPPVIVAPAGYTSWNDTNYSSFPARIGVSITGTYFTAFPNLLFMSNAAPFQVVALSLYE